MLDIGADGLDPEAFEFKDLKTEIEHATTLRIFAIAKALAGRHGARGNPRDVPHRPLVPLRRGKRSSP